MPLHIIKLAVGADSIADLAAWQERRLRQLKKPQLTHVTRMTPKRRDEILAGGSLYWVIKGYTGIRQRIVDLKPAVKDGHPACAIVYDPEIVPVSRRAQRAFQGWRYLKDADAPRDLKRGEADLPEDLQQALGELGLL
ncbi:MAG: DUF1489 domain-containing protein [Alphaproteobacteria bacterium]|nr:DUF1489 domain-containing protein [Alphaproteobacteria bacterium]